MAFTHLEIKNFKSIEHLSLELGQINIIIGPNGVGKSNILEAIGFLSSICEGFFNDSGLLRKGVRLSHPNIYKSSFKNNKEKKYLDIEINLSSENIKYSSLFFPTSEPHEIIKTLQNLIIYHPSTKELIYRAASKQTTPIQILKNELENPTSHEDMKITNKYLSKALDTLEKISNYKIYTPDTKTLRGLIIDNQQDNPIGLSGGRLAEAVQDTKQSLGTKKWKEIKQTLMSLIDWMEDVEVSPSSSVPMSRSIPTTPYILEFKDKYIPAGKNSISGYDASEGALFVLFMLVLSLNKKTPPFFAVDNFDHGINPRLARRLIQEASEWILRDPERQAILTAHNPAVLDGLRLQDDRIRLFTVDRSSSGKTTARRIQVNEELLAKAKEGWSLSRMWLAGFLGGVPDV